MSYVYTEAAKEFGLIQQSLLWFGLASADHRGSAHSAANLTAEIRRADHDEIAVIS
jgi:hypothetical protein